MKKWEGWVGVLIALLMFSVVGVAQQQKPKGNNLSGKQKGPLTAATTATNVVLSWVQGTAPACTPTPCPVTGNKVYRGTTSGGEGATPIASLSTPSTTYNDPLSGLVGGTTYFYQVTAVNVNGESGKSNEVSVLVPAVAVPPNAPTGLTGTTQ